MRKVFHRFFYFIFPHTCLLCQSHGEEEIDLCRECWQDLPLIGPCCRYCARPLFGEDRVCGACLKHAPLWNDLFALYCYDGPIVYMVNQLKFHSKLVYAELLGELMASSVPKLLKADCIIPMPLHARRLRARGFNQALEIARPLSKRLKIPIDIKSCQRIRYTQAQTDISFQDRKKNVRGAFQVDSCLFQKSVIVLDDVITTGETISSLCLALRRVGVSRIMVWCCARAL